MEPYKAKRRYHNLRGVIVLVGITLPTLSAYLLAIDSMGYHAPGSPPHPVALGILFLLGLVIAVVGQQLTAGRMEGIPSADRKGSCEVLHIRLAYSGLAFAVVAFKYVVAGRQVRMYPSGILLIVGGFFMASRLLVRFSRKTSRLGRMSHPHEVRERGARFT